MSQNFDDYIVIRDITETVTTLSVPFTIPGGLQAGGRTTLVKLKSGTIAVFSPVRLTEKAKQKVQACGPVQFIAVLNIEHHLYLGDWVAEYPDAIILGVEGLSGKRATNPDINPVEFTYTFSRTNKARSIHADFDAEFEYEYIAASRNKDVVFHHKPSSTLIQADILFNLPAHEQYSNVTRQGFGLLTRIFNKILTTNGSLIGQKLILWHSVAQDREEFAESVRNIHQWTFDRMIPCHGDVVETGAKPIFDRATIWFRENKARDISP